MWPNSESCSILFWHLAQWQCTTNPEMNFPANPDYHTAHPPQRHPIGLHWKEMEKENLVVELPIPHHTMSKLKSINQMKTIIAQYTQHARDKIMPSETILGCQKVYLQLSLSPAWSPFLRTLKSHNHFPFSSHSDRPQKAPRFIFGPYQLQWRTNKGVLWNSYSAFPKRKLGR